MKTNSNKNFFDVLIVEDEHAIAIQLQEFFSDFGLNSTIAENGKAALDKLMNENFKFKSILTDIKMPVISGIELVKVLDCLDLKNRPKVFIMTGGTDLDFSEFEKLNHKISGVLSKPFKDEQVTDVIKLIANFI